MWVDTDVIDAFRARAEKMGVGYQTEINRALRDAAVTKPLTAEAVEKIVTSAIEKAKLGVVAA
jgi:predicted TIM-barrel enzyme